MDEFVKNKDSFSGFTSQKWNNYEVINKIGSGGMGAVYKAVQKIPHRIVAIKISTSNASDPRFIREMRILANLDHPNIGKIYDAGVVDDYRYMVMEYIDGERLDSYLKKNEHLVLADKINLLIKICSALSYAHRRDIIHRDLKPANIMITKDGEPKIIDFGLAKRMKNSEFALTKAGDIIGTPAFMAPEQVSGKILRINHQTDIYAVGAILYEMFTGKRMVQGDSTLAILYKIKHEKPLPPSKKNTELDKKIDIIWEKAISRHLSRRYADIDLLIKDLRLFLKGKAIRPSYKLLNKLLIVTTLSLAFVVYFLYFTNETVQVTIVDKKQQAVDEIINLIHDRQFSKAKKLLDTSFGLLLLTQIAQAYYTEGKYKEIFNVFKEHRDSEKYKYYQALIYYKKKQYEDAERLLRKLDKDPNLEYYFGICLFENAQKSGGVELYREALNYLLKASKNFEQDIDLLERIADIYLRKNSPLYDRSKAEEFLRKCVDKRPMIPRYSVKLAKIYLEKELYYDAYSLARKVLYVNNQLASAELLHIIPYYKPSLREDCYQALTYKFLQESEIDCPDLFENEWPFLLQKYLEPYMAWFIGQKKQRSDEKGSLLEFKQFVLSKKKDKEIRGRLEEKLLSLRYSKLLSIKIEKLLATDIKNVLRKELSTLREQLRIKCKKETQAMILYQLAYTQKNSTWQKNPFQNEQLAFLPSMLQEDSKTTSILEKYLLAKGCLYFHSFQSLMTITKDDKYDLVTRIICSVVLRENYLSSPIPSYDLSRILSFVETPEDQKFLKVLIAKMMYIPHQRASVDNSHREKIVENGKKVLVIKEDEKKILRKLIEDRNLKVRIAAAASLHCLLEQNIDQPLLQRSARILQEEGMDIYTASQVIRCYTYYMFWTKKDIQKEDNPFKRKQIIDIFRRGLTDPDDHVKEVILSFSEKCQGFMNEIEKELEKCINTETNTNVRFRSMFAYNLRIKKNKFIFDEEIYKNPQIKISPLENSATFIFNFYQFLVSARKNIKAKRGNMNSIVKAVKLLHEILKHLPSLPPASQCMISYQLSLLNICLPEKILRNTTDSKLLCYFLYQLHQEIDLGDLKRMRPFVKAKSKKERRKIAESFLKNENKRVSHFATASYIALGTEQELHIFYLEHKNRKALKKGMALGIYLFIRNQWINNTEKKDSLQFSDIFSWNTRESLYYKILNNMSKFMKHLRKENPHKASNLIDWIKKGCKLDEDNSELIFMKVLFLYDEEFVLNIKKAVELVLHKVNCEPSL
ncbi:protein kinase [Candidatus Uabimicrobium sp. HlEnr_7]|uniref:protein kinase domain-containing protein n=1 Tax=Candidatus Uabimicrobium helgolandensis TaxID=3095367 RepID=UPI003556D7AE